MATSLNRGCFHLRRFSLVPGKKFLLPWLSLLFVFVPAFFLAHACHRFFSAAVTGKVGRAPQSRGRSHPLVSTMSSGPGTGASRSTDTTTIPARSKSATRTSLGKITQPFKLNKPAAPARSSQANSCSSTDNTVIGAAMAGKMYSGGSLQSSFLRNDTGCAQFAE